MDQEPQETRITTDDARAGETSGHMRYVLGISLGLAIIGLSIAWIIPALMGAD